MITTQRGTLDACLYQLKKGGLLSLRERRTRKRVNLKRPLFRPLVTSKMEEKRRACPIHRKKGSHCPIPWQKSSRAGGRGLHQLICSQKTTRSGRSLAFTEKKKDTQPDRHVVRKKGNRDDGFPLEMIEELGREAAVSSSREKKIASRNFFTTVKEERILCPRASRRGG